MNYYVNYTYASSPDGFTKITNEKSIEASSKLEAIDILRKRFKEWHKGYELTDVNCVLTKDEKNKNYVPISPRLAILLDISTREHIKSVKSVLNQACFTAFNPESTVNALREDYALLNSFRSAILCNTL